MSGMKEEGVEEKGLRRFILVVLTFSFRSVKDLPSLKRLDKLLGYLKSIVSHRIYGIWMRACAIYYTYIRYLDA